MVPVSVHTALTPPYVPGQEALAARYVASLEAGVKARIDIGTSAGAVPGAPLTVAQYATKWLKEREALHLATQADDRTRLTKHVLPRIGEMRLDEVRPRHMRDLVTQLRGEGKLAPRTIHHVFNTASRCSTTR